ncbi:MAG: hypothetical protein AB7N61_25910 [Acidimicrobiia bacterium]
MTTEQPWGPPTAHTTVSAGVPVEPVLAELTPIQATKRPMRRLVAGAGVVAVFALGVGVFAANRSDHDSRSTTAFALAKVADNTFAQGTARVSMTMALPLPGAEGTGDTNAMMDGVVDLDRQVASFSMDLAPMLESLGQEVPDGGATMEVVQSGLVMYMHGTMFSEIPGVGDKWLKMDLGAVTKEQGVDLSQFNPSGNNPADSLAMLRSAGEVTEVGTDTVRGVETTHYRTTIDIEKVYRDQGAVVDEEQFQQLFEQFDSLQLPLDVWVDDEGRVRKQEMVMPIDGSEMHMVIEYYDFGAKVDVAVPDDSDTVDFMEALGG